MAKISTLSNFVLSIGFMLLPAHAQSEPTFVVGAGRGAGSHFMAFDPGRNVTQSQFAYGQLFSGGVRVALGDVNGDGVADTITGAGFGGGPHVRVIDGANGLEIASFFAFNPAFTGGIYVASGDINNDGYDDVIVGAGAGAGPHLIAFSGAGLAPGITPAPILSTYTHVYSDGSLFTGGIRVASGDVTGDGIDDVVVGAGPGLRCEVSPNPHGLLNFPIINCSAPFIAVYEGSGSGVFHRTPINSYGAGFDINASLPMGTYIVPHGHNVATANVLGDSRDEIIIARTGGLPKVSVLKITVGFLEENGFVMPYHPAQTCGVSVGGIRDLNGNGYDEIITGTGEGCQTHTRVFSINEGYGQTTYNPFPTLDFTVFGAFAGGLWVAGDK